MLVAGFRLGVSPHVRRYSISYLTRAATKNKIKPDLVVPEVLASNNANFPRSVAHLIVTPKDLTTKFRPDVYDAPSGQLMNETQKLFNYAKPRLEWTLADYEEIPDVKHQDKPKPANQLPEVLFLGHTNSGKSSLINNLLLSASESKTTGSTTEYAYVSNRAGYTRTMNCFNISNKLRLIDSPGYGMYGREEQGEMVVEYIQRRKVLRRAFVLIDSSVGFRDEDLGIIDLLVQQGIGFEVIFTKSDVVISKEMAKHGVDTKKVYDEEKRQANYQAVQLANEGVEKYYSRMIDEAGLLQMAMLPRLLFNNAVPNKYVNRRYGYKEIRATIVESCK